MERAACAFNMESRYNDVVNGSINIDKVYGHCYILANRQSKYEFAGKSKTKQGLAKMIEHVQTPMAHAATTRRDNKPCTLQRSSTGVFLPGK